MYVEMDKVFTVSFFQPSQIRLIYYDTFLSLHVLLGAGGYKTSHECIYFDVFSSGQLHSTFTQDMEDNVVAQGSMLPILILW